MSAYGHERSFGPSEANILTDISQITFKGTLVGPQGGADDPRPVGGSIVLPFFAETAFRTRPLYFGRPWFLPAIIAWYGIKDRLGAGRA